MEYMGTDTKKPPSFMKNALISLAVYVGICLISGIITSVLLLVFPNMDELSRLGIGSVILLVTYYICYWVGRNVLGNTHNILVDLFSVLGIPVIAIVLMFIWDFWSNPANFPARLVFQALCSINNIPWGVGSGDTTMTILYLVSISYLSFSMWMGLIIKRKADGLLPS